MVYSPAVMDDCDGIRATVRALVLGGAEAPAAGPDEEEIREAWLHMSRCPSCRAETSPEERGRFMHAVVLGRE